MKLIARALVLLFAAFPCVAFCQNDTGFFSRVVGGLKTNTEKNPVEKVHLQLDRHSYTAGDDIWFKAYVVAGSKHELSGISGILNVDLINPQGAIQQSVKLPLASGLTWGDFKLADTTDAGNYRIRAYTNWMRNAGDEYFYNEAITIGNANELSKPGGSNLKSKLSSTVLKQAASEKPGVNTIDVKFFPEGGSLVYGISSKVAFKAVGDDGLGKDIKGVVTDDNGLEVARFNSKHLGMGWFDLQPLAGKQYKARVSYPDGSEKTIDLPAPLTTGYVLQVNNSDSLHIRVKIDASIDLLKDSANSRIYLVAQSAGTAYYLANSATHGAALTAIIPASKFPSSVVQFTLFSSSGEPLNERLVFVQNSDQLNLSISANKKQFETRDRVKFEMLAKNNQGQPALGNFSIAVTDESKALTDETAENTICSNLLLTSDIKGYIEKPNYYFVAVNPQTREDLDVLMLTQGYRRFEWKKILNNDFAQVVYQPENSLQIAGYLKTLNDKPSVNTKISLLNSSDGVFTLDTLTDSKGYFAFKNLHFKEGTNFLIQAKLNKNIKIAIDSSGAPPVTFHYKVPVEATPADTNLSAYASNTVKVGDGTGSGLSKHTHQLKEVKIWEKKVIKNSTNLNGAGNADQVLLGKDIDTGCPALANCLTGKLLSVYFFYDYYGVGHPMTSRSGQAKEMKIMLDGFLIDANTMNTIAPETVESVEILRSSEFTSIYGNDGYSGLILINTKKGWSSESGSNHNIVNYTPKGYYKAREFYAPKYDKAKIKLPGPDLRSTVYWNPNVPTDKDGKASIEYFNTDARGLFKVVIEGIDSNGNLGRLVYHYKVE